MFPYACSRSCAKASINKVRNIIALALPSLRPKLFWVREILRVEMIRNGHHSNCCPFFNRDSIQVVIFVRDTREQLCSRSKTSVTLFLQHFNILQILQVLKTVVFSLHAFFDLLSHFPLYLWVLRNLINHVLSKDGSRFGASHEKCHELLIYLSLLEYKLFVLWIF